METNTNTLAENLQAALGVVLAHYTEVDASRLTTERVAIDTWLCHLPGRDRCARLLRAADGAYQVTELAPDPARAILTRAAAHISSRRQPNMTTTITDDQIRHVASRHFLVNDASLHAIADRALGDLTAVPNHDREEGPPTTDECRASMAYYRSQFASTCARCRGPSDLAALRTLVESVTHRYGALGALRGRRPPDNDPTEIPRIFRRADGRQFIVASAQRMMTVAVAVAVLVVGLGACVATTDAATSQQAQESVVCQQILCYPYTAVVHQGVLTVGVDPAADAGCRVGCEGAVGHCSTDWDGGGSHQEGVRTLVDVAWELYDAPLAQANFINQQGGTCESTSAF